MYTLSVADNTQLIVITMTSHLFGAGWRGAMSDGNINSDASWKCTSTLYNGWQNIGFDGSGWTTLVVKVLTAAVGCAGLPAEAKWL